LICRNLFGTFIRNNNIHGAFIEISTKGLYVNHYLLSYTTLFDRRFRQLDCPVQRGSISSI